MFGCQLKKYKLGPQPSGPFHDKGNCYDNACAESCFHSLKVEVIHGERFEALEAMRYIELAMPG